MLKNNVTNKCSTTSGSEQVAAITSSLPLVVLLLVCFTICTFAQSLSESEKALFRGDANALKPIATTWLKTHPTSASARVLLARATMAQGNFHDAYIHLRKALATDPNNH